jgi:hypothetical protein
MTGMTISSDREVDDLSQVMVSPYRDAYAHGACEDVEGGEDIAMDQFLGLITKSLFPAALSLLHQ